MIDYPQPPMAIVVMLAGLFLFVTVVYVIVSHIVLTMLKPRKGKGETEDNDGTISAANARRAEIPDEENP